MEKRIAFINYQKLAKCNLDKLKNKKFIFFPLLTEPEVALHGIAMIFSFNYLQSTSYQEIYRQIIF